MEKPPNHLLPPDSWALPTLWPLDDCQLTFSSLEKYEKKLKESP
jgi:hypothetical protein